VGAFFDPRQKNAKLIYDNCNSKKTEVTNELRRLFISHFQFEFFDSNQENTEETHIPKKMKPADLFSELEDDHEVELKKAPTNRREAKSCFEFEYRHYVSMDCQSLKDQKDFDILSWWKSVERELPSLSRVARSVLAIPASSSKSESNFSEAKNLLGQKRTNLDPKKVENLVISRSNYDLIPSFDHLDIE
jgi:hypothetical protein